MDPIVFQMSYDIALKMRRHLFPRQLQLFVRGGDTRRKCVAFGNCARHRVPAAANVQDPHTRRDVQSVQGYRKLVELCLVETQSIVSAEGTGIQHFRVEEELI